MKGSTWMFPSGIAPFGNSQHFLHKNQIRPGGNKKVKPLENGPARTFIQQLCDDTGCNPKNLPEAMNDREMWRERAWDIRASRTT